jgi:hypothetical protein
MTCIQVVFVERHMESSTKTNWYLQQVYIEGLQATK